MAQYTATTNPILLTVNENVSIRAVFEQLPPVTPTPTPTRGVSSTPAPSSTPAITPTPSPVFWKSCLDGKLTPGKPPTGYVSSTYSGESGGVCWTPTSQVGFSPGLDKLQFTYSRQSGLFPKPLNVTAQNPSNSLSYQVKFTTNNTYFTVNPPILKLSPGAQVPFTVSIKSDTINQLDDGNTAFALEVEITQV